MPAATAVAFPVPCAGVAAGFHSRRLARAHVQNATLTSPGARWDMICVATASRSLEAIVSQSMS